MSTLLSAYEAPDLHCTGWRATHELARQLPNAYVQTRVGTRMHFA